MLSSCSQQRQSNYTISGDLKSKSKPENRPETIVSYILKIANIFQTIQREHGVKPNIKKNPFSKWILE